jgi:hypothetical protein
MGNMNKDSDMGIVVVETILAVPGVWFSNAVTWDGPLANTIQLLVPCSQEINAHASLSLK